MKKTYIIKDQGKGLVENLTPDKLFDIANGTSSSGQVGNYIPLTGTEEGKPAGPIQIYHNGKIFSRNIATGPKIENTVGFSFSGLRLTHENTTSGWFSNLEVKRNGVIVYGSESDFMGVYSQQDYSEVDPTNKLIYAQRAYVDKVNSYSNSYSTEETLTGGTWIDGKPIYRKIINTGVLNDEQYVNCNIDVYPEIETIASAKCICLRNITYQSLNIDNEVLQFNFDTQASGLTVSGQSYVCLEYTKTTDIEMIM